MPFKYVEFGRDLKPVKAVTIDQASMTAECWSVQIKGLEACKSCELRDTDDCGGENIRKTGKNEKGFPVPL